MFRYLERNEIDIKKWNSCIYYAPNSLVYAYSWYLDNVCDTWSALVFDDYSAVFPIVHNKILGMNQIYQPYLTQQLGLFSYDFIQKQQVVNCIESIPSSFRKIHLHLNESNICNSFGHYSVFEKPNYLLSLYNPYELIQAQYSENTLRNIKKAKKSNLYAHSSLSVEQFLNELESNQKILGNHYKAEIYHTASRIMYNAMHRGVGQILSIFNQSHECLASIFWIHNGARYINLLNYSNLEGRAKGAMPYLVDLFIQQHSEKMSYIDFEGSSIDSIARFYKSFGAENHPYFVLKKNKLPFPLPYFIK